MRSRPKTKNKRFGGVGAYYGTGEPGKHDYNDGEPAEEVNAFDVPVPAIDEEFDLALIGTKGKWYDHKVSVSNPVKAEE